MGNLSNIKAILFDSGHTLNYPRTGNWFIPPNFFKYVDRTLFASIDPGRINEAFSRAMKYLDSNHLVLDEATEYEQFTEFYRMISSEFSELEISNTAISDIAKDTVFNDNKFVFYDDVMEMIPKLSRNYMLGIVSDTWPSLERVYINTGLRGYFTTFVMSCALGIYKPDPIMYRTALSELGIKPCEALFVDDSIKNIEGAKMLGMHSVLILRKEKGKPEHDIGYNYVTNLTELESLLQRSEVGKE